MHLEMHFIFHLVNVKQFPLEVVEEGLKSLYST